MFKVLFVCTGNICRSPTAEGVFRALVEAQGLDARIAADSAGTHGYHIGEPPDRRACRAAMRRGIDIRDLRARRIDEADFASFDLLLAMDRSHLARLSRLAPRDARDRVRLFLSYAPEFGQDVPDPYYEGAEAFERVLDMIEIASGRLLDAIRREHLRSGKEPA